MHRYRCRGRTALNCLARLCMARLNAREMTLWPALKGEAGKPRAKVASLTPGSWQCPKSRRNPPQRDDEGFARAEVRVIEHAVRVGRSGA